MITVNEDFGIPRIKMEDKSLAEWQEAFKLAQLSSAKQKLSERNVIEIVSKLVELGLVKVIYTVDGKEYLTPDELVKEIKEELDVHGGRINLVELTQILNVDFSHVELAVNNIVKSEKHLSLVLGNLIDKSYLDSLAEEVNDRLQEKGHVTIAQLTSLYDLPADFLSQTIHSRIGKIVKGKVDSYDKDVIFTDAFVGRMRAQIRGAFSAITRPILLGSIIQHYKFHERIFYTTLEDLVNTKRLAGSIIGGRQEKATYIPNIYTKTQNEWVDTFYKQNGYLEYDALVRLGITDPKGFIKKRYKSEPLVYLSTCCAGRGIQEFIEASVEEALSAGSWVDVMPLLPSIFSENDAGHLLTTCLKSHPGAMLCCDTIIASEKLLSHCAQPFPDLMAVKAEKDTKSHPAFRLSQAGADSKSVAMASEGSTKEDRKEQRKKKAAASTKSGGGTQGREIKTKAVKKKGYKGRDSGRDANNDSDDEPGPRTRSEEIEFMSIEEIEDVIRKDKSLEDCPEELVTEIAQQLYRPLTRQYQDVAKSIFLQSTGAATGSARKKTHGELQEKITGLWTNAKLFEKGLNMFSEDVKTQLVRHLLRTVCTDLTNLALNAVATDHMMSVSDESQMTTESRAKLISQLPGEVQPILTKLNASLNAKTLDTFFTQFDAVCGPSYLGLLLKKPDKKREKQLTFSHRQTLCAQITEETDAAMTLHLATVILFQKFTQNIVHAPGRCVPQVLAFLKDYLEPEKYEEMILLQVCVLLEREFGVGPSVRKQAYLSIIQLLREGKYSLPDGLRDLVIAQLQKQQTDSEEKQEVPNMDDFIKKVKEIALTAKKASQAAAAAAED